jgi:hypothetical protein
MILTFELDFDFDFDLVKRCLYLSIWQVSSQRIESALHNLFSFSYKYTGDLDLWPWQWPCKTMPHLGIYHCAKFQQGFSFHASFTQVNVYLSVWLLRLTWSMIVMKFNWIILTFVKRTTVFTYFLFSFVCTKVVLSLITAMEFHVLHTLEL